jgi:hypothetical protein
VKAARLGFSAASSQAQEAQLKNIQLIGVGPFSHGILFDSRANGTIKS